MKGRGYRYLALVSILTLATFVLGCAAPPATLDVGYHGSDRGYVDALRAADAWNQACGVELVRVHRGDGEIELYETLGTERGQAFGETVLERPFLGMIGPKRATEIRFMIGWGQPVLAHEFGHSLGLGHEARGIMQPGVELLQVDADGQLLPGLITEEDCAAVLSRSR